MEVIVTGRHIKVGEEMRRYVSSKVERLAKHFNGIHKLEVTLDREGERYKAEMVVHAVKGVNLVAEADAESEVAAVDLVLDRIDRQVLKMKDRLKDKRSGPMPGEGA